MSDTVGAFEAKNRFSELLDRVSRGEEIVITRHDQAVARLVPARQASLPEIQALIAEIKSHRTVLNPRGKPKLRLKDLVNQGRP